MVANTAQKHSHSLSCSQPLLIFATEIGTPFFYTCTNKVQALLKCLLVKYWGEQELYRMQKKDYKLHLLFIIGKNDFHYREKEPCKLHYN
jgi:hypothetical protein